MIWVFQRAREGRISTSTATADGADRDAGDVCGDTLPEREVSNGVFGIQAVCASEQFDDVWSFSIRSHLVSEERAASVASRTGSNASSVV
jgi:hypothetical protein